MLGNFGRPAKGSHPVKTAARTAALLALLLATSPPAHAHILPRPFKLSRINRKLHGHIVDHTANHGHDRRIWSQALCQRRDLYVYLPPGFDPCHRYPIIILLHGFRQDEMMFLESVVCPLDQAMACGKLPPAIVAAPDGSKHGVACLASAGTFFLNSNMGKFEDYLVHDVWDFLISHYPIRPEREAHVMMGVSMGGGAAFNKAFKFSDRFGVAVGIFPPLNLRWLSCRGCYMDDFDPCCWGWRTDFSNGHEVVGRFYGVYTIRLRRVIYPLYGKNNPETLSLAIQENPIEMLDLYHIKPGQVQMYVGYAGKDEFNIDAQVESFLYRARQKCLEVGVGYESAGRHNEKTALKLLPGMLEWLRPRLEPFSPPLVKH
jgi:S-formylglutathione hydrolase FrmB